MNPLPRTVQWIGDLPGHVRLIDQTLLPTQVEYRDCRTVEEVWEALQRSAWRRQWRMTRFSVTRLNFMRQKSRLTTRSANVQRNL